MFEAQMETLSGRSLAHFRLRSRLGAGGMGEVWSAEDSRLGREVALKLLPSELGSDRDSLARFEREARLLAALNHPHIASIYSFETAPWLEDGSDGSRAGVTGAEGGAAIHFLVMELVRGETLLERIRRGSMPLDDVLRIARQLCEALEAAHADGIVHRDLKPSNVMLDGEGRVKVLDFGLAKAFSPTGSEEVGRRNLSISPTLTARSGIGVVLGTAAYMSPEQASGKRIDKRTDIWSFGVVLWEMLTGRRLFSGESVTDTIAEVLRGEIKIDEIPRAVPPPLRELLRRCLERDPRHRLHDIADARLVIEELEARPWQPAVPEARRPRLSRWLPAVAGLLGLAAGAFLSRALMPWREGPAPEPSFQFEIPVPDATSSRPALSPDGSRVAYASQGRLWIRDLDRIEPQALEGGDGGTNPFWSPDGQSLGFFADLGLWRLPIGGGQRTLLTEAPPGSLLAALWQDDDRILFTTGSAGVLEVSGRGGQVRPVVELLEDEVDFHHLTALPRDDGYLVVTHRLQNEDYGNVTALLDGQRVTLFQLEGEQLYHPTYSDAGYVLFQRNGTEAAQGVWAIPVTLDPLRPAGEPLLLARRAASPAVRGGTLVYAPAPAAYTNELVWLDRTGSSISSVGEPRAGLYSWVRVSPDGGSAVVAMAERIGSALYRVDLEGGHYTRISFDQSQILSASWHPNGEEIVYSQSTGSDVQIRRKRADSSTTSEFVTTGLSDVDFSRDGRTLVFSRPKPGLRLDLWTHDLETGEERAFIETVDWDFGPAFSPDGGLVAATTSGSLVVARYPEGEPRWQIAGGGVAPVWRADGRRLYFLVGTDMMEAAIDPGPTLRASPPVRLFRMPYAPNDELDQRPRFAVSPDGERFLVVRTVGQPPGIVVHRNWQRDLER